MEGQWEHRILIIDSDEHALSIIKNLLLNDGFDVTTACGGEMALSFLQSERYELVLVDDQFADLTSSCFLKQFLQVPRTVPVIVMEGGPSRPCGLAPYNPLRASGFVNKWRPCEILEAARAARSAPIVQSADHSGG